MTFEFFIKWVDTLDVWGLALMTGYCFYKVLILIQTIQRQNAVQEVQLTHLEKATDESKETLTRIDDKIEGLRNDHRDLALSLSDFGGRPNNVRRTS